jgi:O-antigen/teichoic acid export membrane protein
MVAFINTFVAGAGITLLSRYLGAQTLVALLAGLGTALVLVAVFFAYQKWRFRLAEPAAPATLPARHP